MTAKDIESRLEAARQKERRALQRVAALKREMTAEDRRRDARRKITLGAAVAAWTQADPAAMNAFKAFLASYLTRETDREILSGTPWCPR